ncbi:MAG TPA: penicillin acylase family protein, partial [Symbiobacteriaceae bacterium]|nr:penicillin acylase family protein [Symbiobacteriaceae bacterium]
MIRLFGFGGLLVFVVAGLAVATGVLVFRLLTLVLSLALLGLYLYLRYSMPRHRGVLELAGLRDKVEVYIDDVGIPHIYAGNVHDLYFAQGYITAQDRLWSMDLLRRAASGRLAEILGEKALPLDRHFRDIGLHRAAEASYHLYQAETRTVLDAYAAGVNARISEGKLPLEFLLLRYRPQPWSAVDTLTIGKYAGYRLVGNWDRELFRAKLTQVLGVEKTSQLFPTPPDPELMQLLHDTPLPDVDELLALAAQTIHESSGTNGWAVSGSKTRSGAPMLANDPHLPVSNPGAWYQCHLVGPEGLDVTGVTFPGIPGVLLGRNQDIAWGATNFNTDSQDVFLEKVNPTAPDEFLFEGSWEKAQQVNESIVVRGKSRPVDHEVFITRHGPVIARGQETALALSWVALLPSTEMDTVLAINRARSWPEFREALRSYTAPPQHFLFAGNDGTIAVRTACKVPVRSGDGQILVPGWTSQFDWQGYVPFDEAPELVNPECGFVTAFDPTFNPRLSSFELPSHRTQRIAELLGGASDLTLEKAQSLQQDSVNHHARLMLQLLLATAQEGLRQGPHPETLNPTEKLALLMLSGWDCCEAPDKPEPMLWHQWYLFLVEGIFRPQMGLDLFDQFVASGLPQQTTDRLV